MTLTPLRTNRWQFWQSGVVLRAVFGGLCLLALWGILYQPDSAPARLTDAQMMAVLTTHCPALRQQPDVLGCLPDPAGIRLITDRPALMPTKIAGLPVLTEPPPPHLPPPPGVIVLRPEGPDPQPTLSDCPPGTTEQQKYRWRFCNSPTDPQPIPTSLMTPPIAGMPYTRAEAIFQRQDFMELPGVQSVSLEADGIVVQTTEPLLIPSTLEGLPVRTEAAQGIFYLTSHTQATLLSTLKGGIAIGPSSGRGGGTLGGFVWSGGEPWLVTAAHIFPSKCGDIPPCPANVPLHQCPQTHANGIPVKLAPKRTSPAPPQVSTLTRWTPLTNNVTVKADVAAGPVNVNDYPISRRLEDFSDMVTGNVATPMRGDRITIVSSISSTTLNNRSYESPHALPGQVTAATMHFTDADERAGTADDGWSIRSCGENTIVVKFQDVFKVEADADPPGSSTPVLNQINRNYVLEGTSGALVIDGKGNILGMEFGSRKGIRGNDIWFTRTAYAAKASNIKTALKFEKWVGSETVPVEGQVVNPNQTSTIRGWAYDPLNPSATLKVEMYAGGKKGTGKKVGSTLMASLSQEAADIEDISGAGPAREGHGFREGRIPPQYSRSPFYVYALQPDSSPEKWELLDGSGVRPWPATAQTIDSRDGNPDQNNKPQRIAISVNNDTPPPPTVNFPVDPNAKAAIGNGLDAVWTASKDPNNPCYTERDNKCYIPQITSININSTVREKDLQREKKGKKQSPHVCGRGVDINRINGKAVRCAHPDFRRHSRCIMLTNDQIRDLKNQVEALQDAFLEDSRVNQVLGPRLNRNRLANGETSRVTNKDLIKRHRNHIHITVNPTPGRPQCPS